MRSLLWGDDVHGVAVPALLSASIPMTGNQSYPVYRLFTAGICIILASGLYYLISNTRLGMKIRAGAFNRDMAEALGINIKLIHAIVFAIGVGLAAIAGMIAAPISSVYPNMGADILSLCFVVVVIGAIGSVARCFFAPSLLVPVATLRCASFPPLAALS